MEDARKELDQNQAARFREAQVIDWTGTDFRPDLAFPKLTEEMVERLKPYGHEETFPADETLYTYGDHGTSICSSSSRVGWIFSLPTPGPGVKIYSAESARFDFTGELNLL